MSSSDQPYTVPPPSYANAPAKKSYGTGAPTGAGADQQPLLSNEYASGSQQPSNDWLDEGDERDDVEDFKIGITVSQSSQDVRAAFIRKVYGVLFCQIVRFPSPAPLSAQTCSHLPTSQLGTTIVGALMSTDSASMWVREHSGLMMIPMFGAIGAMLAVYWKAHSHPANILLLGLFTLFEAITVGSVVSYFNQTVVLQALVITTFVFIGLTLFTLQSKYDFSNMGTYLFAALLVFFLTGIIGLFIPYSKTTDMVIAGAGCLLFSAYIVYDTHLLMNRLHIDDWVIACVSLYLDLLNLFLQILRLLSDIQRD